MTPFTKSHISLSIALLIAALTTAIQSCTHSGQHADNPVFEVLDQGKTGIDFSNTLPPTKGFNVFDYMYLYNGGGVGAGDFNGDGRIDLFFASSQGQNKLYLNTGDLHFK